MDFEKIFPSFSSFEERDKILVKRAVDTLLGNVMRKGNNDDFVFGERAAVVPSPRTYKGVWNWDSGFHTIAFSYFDKSVAHDQMRILFDFQKADGQIADVVYANGKTVFKFTKPPVLAWSIMCSDKIFPDDEFLRYCYEPLKKNLNWWETNRFDGTLFGYKVHKMESGWDNTVRFDFPHPISSCYAIDCNCFMVDFYRAMEYIAKRIGAEKDVETFFRKRKKLSDNINTLLYNKKKGYYCDYNFRLKRFTNRVSPASFMPLFCGIASKEQAESMKKLAQSSRWFYKGIPTISYNNLFYNHAKYWRGPCWLNTAYFTIRGLYDYGYKQLAKELCENLLDWCSQNKDSIYEYYDSKTGKGLGAKDFGWSSAFIIELILLKYGQNII